MAVTLREITKDTVRPVVRLSVAEDQKGFVAPNAVSLAEALFSEEAWYRAVYDGEELVGFVMVFDESQRKAPPEKPDIGLWRLMVDQRFQRRGIGRAILDLVAAHARAKGFTELYTSYVPGDLGPKDFYIKYGFEPTGKVDEGEIQIRLDLSKR